MAPAAVVSDTTGYMPAELVERLGVRLVSLWVSFGPDETVRESDLPDFRSFYEALRSRNRLPTTSQPSVGDFEAAYRPLLEAGHDVVSIHLSGGLSGTVDAARQAATALERDGAGGERIRVLDSETAAGGLGLLVIGAARAAAGGLDAADVAGRVMDARRELKTWVSLDTLEFVRRGGRIGAASAWIGSTLRVKPILTVESQIVPVERVRTSARMLERLVDYARQRHESGADAWVVQHSEAAEPAAELVARCREVFSREPEFVSEVGPVIGTHAGPGLLGLSALPARFVDGTD